MPILETYEYDYLGNRTAKTSNGVTTEYVTDLSSGYSQILKAETDTSTVYYTRGFELISRREGALASYYIYDGGLSVRALTNESGTVTDTLVFDAFGNETGRTGTTDNPYGFQGEEQDATGLYYLRARYMDPATGTFTTMDTYGGSLSDPMSLHKYLFANSNPVMYSDPSGHEATLQGIVTAMTISAILSAADSGITYYLKYKDSDTAKYGKTVFGWNVATAAMNGFLNGFILGVFFYALCSLLVVRMVLSVIGLCLGIKQGVAGIDEINSSHGNTALGVYNLIKGFILITVSTIGIAQSGMEFLEKYGDGIESFGKVDEYSYPPNQNKTPASEIADKLRKLPSACRPNKVAVIETTDGTFYIGFNSEGVYNQSVQSALDGLGNSNVFGRQCAEINAISKAVNSGADLFGSTISVTNIRGPESVTGIHGTPKAPCDVCKPLLGYYGITVVT